MEELEKGPMGFDNANVDLFSVYKPQGQVGHQPAQP